jgi:putative ABC transport system permease protein
VSPDRRPDRGASRWLEPLVQDVRFAARTLRKTPTFTVAVITTLALTTGATAAIFSVVNSVLLRPLPFPNADRLVEVTQTGQVGGPGAVLSGDLQEFRRQSAAFDSFTTHFLTTKHVERPGGPVRLSAVLTDLEFFLVLGVAPLVGRTFDAESRDRVVVLSAQLWTEEFNRDPSVIGGTITLTGQMFDQALQRSVIDRSNFTVLGVMPDRFQFPYGAASTLTAALPESRTDLWVYDEHQSRGGRMYVTGRLKPGVTIEQGAAELAVIKQRIDAAAPNPYRPLSVNVRSMSDAVLGSISRSLWLLAAAVTLVLAVACVNIASLLLARTTERRSEFATRAAVGATRLRLLRQSLTESTLLALVGGGIGAVVGRWTLELLLLRAAPKIPRAHEVAFAWEVFAFLLVLCLAAAVLFGLTPAVAAARTSLRVISEGSAARTTESRALVRVRDGLIAIEIAVAFVLAVGAVGVIRQLQQLHATDSGMVTTNVLTLHLTPRAADEEYFRLEDRVRKIPGVMAAGFIQLVPLQNWGWIGSFQIAGRAPTAERPIIELRTVTPGYFEALTIPIRAGRNLTEHDRLSKPRAVLVNETLARQFFRETPAIGQATDRGVIVGVVGDVRQAALDRPPVPEIYDTLGPSAGIASDIGMSLVVRTAGAPQGIADEIRQAVREINPSLAIFNVRTMEQIVADSLWELNLYRWLIGLFAALALLLAVIGLYGVVSYSVLARTRELALRLAMGSAPWGLARAVIGRGCRLAALGVALGALAAMPLTQRLPEGSSLQPRVGTTVGVALALIAVALLASAIPAIRATRIDPATALRDE